MDCSDMTSRKATELVESAKALVESGDATKEQLETTVSDLADVVAYAVSVIDSMESALRMDEILFAAMGLKAPCGCGECEKEVIDSPAD